MDEESKSTERFFAALILLGVAIGTMWDLWIDFQVGGSVGHLLLEGALVIGALVGAWMIWGRYRLLRQEHRALERSFVQVRESEKHWKEESRKHIQGLSQAIDDQLDRWKLTPAEKDVCLLVLKGLSFKEIASLRETSERTVRQQCLSIYEKSGLGGRAELAAFFLEDLLSPRELPHPASGEGN